MAVVINAGSGAGVGSAIVGLAAVGQPTLTAPPVGTPALTVDGPGGPLVGLLSGRVETGWDKPISEARILCATDPGLVEGDAIAVRMGRSGTPAPLRFVGDVRSVTDRQFPRQWEILAKSALYKAQEYQNHTNTSDTTVGLDIADLLGGPSSGRLRAIGAAVLTTCRVPFDPANFADPPHVYGLVGPEGLTWKVKETGLAFLQKLEEASAGYRWLFSGDGLLYLAQVIGTPRNAIDIPPLVEGLDLLADPVPTRLRTAEQSRNAITITGYDADGGDPLLVVVTGTNPFQGDGATTPVPEEKGSPLIEDEAFATEIGRYWRDELCRELEYLTLATWRDDVMGPAQTHWLDIPSQGVSGKYWLVNHVCEVSPTKGYTATNRYVGTGPGASYTPVPV